MMPATNDPPHLEDNKSGGMGRLPDKKMRRRMTDLVVTLSSWLVQSSLLVDLPNASSFPNVPLCNLSVSRCGPALAISRLP